MASNKKDTLVDEKLAISLFLDSLLRETETVTEADIKTETEIKVETEIQEAELKVETLTPTLVPDIDVKIEAPVEVELETQTITETEEDVQLVQELPLFPEWAREPFQILLFHVAGLKLAVPLMELSSVIKWTDSVTEMPGHADFYMGILQHLGHKVAVIDTAKMVLPEKQMKQILGENPRDRVKHIVLIDDYRWGLACDEISEVITLKPEEVRWRTSKTSRNWLAGTVVEHMCALLNSDGFSELLKTGQKL